MTSVLKEMDKLLAKKAEERREEQERQQQLYKDFLEANADRARLLVILGEWLDKVGLVAADIPVSVGYLGSTGGQEAVLQYRSHSWQIDSGSSSLRYANKGVNQLDSLGGQQLLAMAAIPWIVGWIDETALKLCIEPPVFSDHSDESTDTELESNNLR